LVLSYSETFVSYNMPFRIIPILLISNGEVVKTQKFKRPRYIGDPLNIIKIFNAKEIDELIVLDIDASKKKSAINFKLIEDIASECFFPLTYGGGVKNLSDVNTLIKFGIEKVSIQTSIFERPEFISDVVQQFGSQSVVASIDIKKNFLGKQGVYSHSKNKIIGYSIEKTIADLEQVGIGELLINDVDRDGTMSGYDLNLVKQCAQVATVPVIMSGGLSGIGEMRKLYDLGISAAAGGAYFIFQGAKRGILVTYPEEDKITKKLGDRFE
jgi:cyclase